MFALALVAASTVHALPKECHLDFSGWTGAEAVRIVIRVTTTDGTVFEYSGEIAAKTTPENVRDVLGYRFEERGLRGYQVGKTIYVIQGAKNSAVRSIDFKSKSWKPDVRWVLLPPEKKAGPPVPAEAPRVTLYFHTGANDTKATRLPTGTRIQIRVEAGDYEYDYDTPTIEGETVGDIATQVYENMKTAGWKLAYLEDRTGFTVYGRLPIAPNMAPIYKVVDKVGIHYSTAAQPVAPGTQGKVQLLVLEKGKWKPAPKP